jgi:hypothetical protein
VLLSQRCVTAGALRG